MKQSGAEISGEGSALGHLDEIEFHGRLAADGAAGEILRDRTLLEENGLELPLCLAGVPDGI